jgi:hypothetical protein
MAKEKVGKPKRSRRNRTFPSRVFMTRTRVTLARFDFITKARYQLARFDWLALRDNLSGLLLLALMVFLLILFCTVPLFVGRRYGHGWGILISLLEFPLLSLLGIRPQPGLIQGAFCVVMVGLIFWTACLETIAFVISLFH